MRSTMLIFLLMASTVVARTIHVPDNYGVLQHAVNAAEDGDSIVAASGEYQRITVEGLKNLTIIGAGLEAEEPSIIYGLPATQTETAVHILDCTGIEIAGFEITKGYTAVWIDRSKNCRVHHNYIHDLPDWWSSSVSVNSSCDVTIERNVMLRSRHYGIYISFDSRDVEIRNNVIAYMTCNDGIHIDRANGVNVCNNIVSWNGNVGICVTENARNVRIAYNDMFGNENDEYTGFRRNRTNLRIDPKMTAPQQGNFHLASGSPCIDSGDPETPFDPDGTRSDMGVFYFHHQKSSFDDLKSIFGL